MNYRPLPKVLTIQKSDIEGLGLFASDFIPANVILGICHNIDAKNKIQRTPLGGFINHSESPNCVIIEESVYFYLKTIKQIYKDSEVTVDYRDTTCGSSYVNEL